MLTINEQISKEREELKQLKRQQRAQNIKDRKTADAIDTRRKIILGEMVSKYFPEVLHFQPRQTRAENDFEFLPLANFLSMLAADKSYVSELGKKESTEHQQE
ncbi:hypothetical protein LQZ18_04030 [Lachnospiraceae bacterium ZAX-1]